MAAKVLGVRHGPHVLRQGLPAHEPRGYQRHGGEPPDFTDGRCHAFGFTIRDEDDLSTKMGKGHLAKKIQVSGSRMDAMKMCNFVRHAVRHDMTPLFDLIKGFYGVDFEKEEIDNVIKETLRLEHAFNAEAGITVQDHRFAESFYEEAQPETGEKIGMTDKEVFLDRQ